MSGELLEHVFEKVAAAIKRAAAERNYMMASKEAERLGDGTPSIRHHWER
ncbi:hypothetical protein Amn_20880 [Aminobacter sp. Y103A]|nr:hypothetical protein [Aminobacter sp. SS-2016]BBD37208.1 hypothetical protein Amn_20880 [Aminobacter sp. SS-2016]